MLRERLWARREARARAERAVADREAQRALSDERDVRRAEARALQDATVKEERAERKRAHEAEWEGKRRAEADARARLEDRRGYAQVDRDMQERQAAADSERARLMAERRAAEAERRTRAVQGRLGEFERLVATRPRQLAARRPAVAAAYASGGARALATAVVDGLTAAAHPSGLPHAYEARYDPERRALRVTFELPARTIVPAVAGYEFVEAHGVIAPVPRTVEDGDAAYARVTAGAAIRVLAGVVDLTPPELVERVAVAAYAPADRRATGRPGVTWLVELEATRPQAEALALDAPGFDPPAAVASLAPTHEPTA
jgi:hypothetical protein